MKAPPQEKKQKVQEKTESAQEKTESTKKQNAPKKTAAGLHDWLLSYLIQYELN